MLAIRQNARLGSYKTPMTDHTVGHLQTGCSRRLTRASQINGCAVCVDMHTRDAGHAGETSVRLNLVAAWRDAKVFTEAERAALELTERGTRIADAAGGVTDEAWTNAAKHYDTDQLAALVCLIAGINAWNRLNVISRNQGGDYQPGQWG
jgi:AhpD family alkylhydroperoxidase